MSQFPDRTTHLKDIAHKESLEMHPRPQSLLRFEDAILNDFHMVEVRICVGRFESRPKLRRLQLWDLEVWRGLEHLRLRRYTEELVTPAIAIVQFWTS